MSEIKVNKITPRTDCGTTQLGDSGDTVTVTGDLRSDSLKAADGGVIISVVFKIESTPRPPRIHNLPSGSTTLDAKTLGVFSNATLRHLSFGSTRLGLKKDYYDLIMN